MAGGKETPRQKMIGMMYLVLTALLALNVSKSILDAFVAIEENMQMACLTELARGNEKLGDLESVQQDKSNPGASAKADLLIKAVAKIDKLTAEQIVLIDDLKILVLGESGEDMKTIGKEESIVTIAYDKKKNLLKPTRMNLMHVQAKDQYDIPMAIMIGPDTDIKNPTGKGMDLWNSLKKFRDVLCEEVAGSQVSTDTSGNVSFATKFKYKAPDIIEFKDQTELGIKLKKDIEKQGTVNEEDVNEIIEIYRGLTKFERSTVHDIPDVHWIGKTFDHSPSVAAIASLTSMEMEVLAARARAVAVLRARVGGGEYSFNKVMPLAYGPEVVNANEEFTVEVLMAAFDTDKQPIVMYGGETVTDVRDGKGYLKLKGSGSKMELKGTVAIRKKNGDLTTRDWTKTVTIMKPSGSIELPEMNMLYRGYPNKVNATASGYPETSLGASGASVSSSGDGYIVKPVGRGKTATLTVSGRTPDGKSVQLKSMSFRCSNLPNPSLYWGGTASGGKASKSQTTLFAKYPPEIPLNAKFSVVNWECQVPGAMGRPPAGPGSNISAASNLLRAARSGSQVSFICTVVGPDGIQRKLAGAYKI
ncbi:MAG: gliding motility-associated protein GldM [Flavobacteriaceae bacterium]|jgi:gliding motility-associated protein GldM